MTGNDIRRIVIEQSLRTGASHIGSCLSVADILAVLYTDVLKSEDRFILSKGHSAYALYAALYLAGRLTPQGLDDACEKHHHPHFSIPGVEFSTGSLGQGITYAVGVAEALRRKGSTGRVYCLLSDAECQEGSVWEAARVAVELQLNNLVILLDDNSSGALGGIEDNWLTKFGAFGIPAWQCSTDGSLEWHIKHAIWRDDTPTVISARTHLGAGVSFMQDQLAWHYKSLTPELAAQALEELRA